VRLADVIGRFLGKVEIVLAGADEDLREGEEALARGDAMGARAAARRVLTQAPDSPVGLALLADACELGHLDAELALTLEELARRAPSQAEVWVRLARARQTTGAPAEDVRDSLVRALAVADSGTEARIDALMGLADLDLAQGDGARAELWIERLAPVASVAPAVAVRSAEARLLRGDAAGAKEKLDGVQLAATDGRGALARGRALAMLGDEASFEPWFLMCREQARRSRPPLPTFRATCKPERGSGRSSTRKESKLSHDGGRHSPEPKERVTPRDVRCAKRLWLATPPRPARSSMRRSKIEISER
jgi:hypothetical protein